MGDGENLVLMKTLDDAWNAGPDSPLWETFRKRHREDVKVYWPNQPEPTVGGRNHDLEAVEFFKKFDNRLVNDPYKIAFSNGDHTCTVALLAMKESFIKYIPPRNVSNPIGTKRPSQVPQLQPSRP